MIKRDSTSKQADRLAELLGIEVENTPPYRADWKGIVERQFKLLPAKFSADVKGYVEKDFGLRTGRDYRLDACLNVQEFTKIAIHCVLEHNCTPVGGYPLENEMVAEEIPPVPNNLWAWGMKNRMGKLMRHSENKILFALLPVTEATVTPKGITFLGRSYYAPSLDKRAWFTKARKKGRYKVVISYHPHNLDIILLHDPAYRDQFTPCVLISSNSSDHNLYAEEIAAQMAKSAKTTANLVFNTLATRMTHQKAVEDIVASASAEKSKFALPQTKKERISNIRNYRAVEKGIYRLIDGSSTAHIPSHTDQTVAPKSENAPSAKRFARTPIFSQEKSNTL